MKFNKSTILLRIAHAFSTCVVYPFCYYILRYRRTMVRLNLEQAFPHKTHGEIKTMEKAFYRNFADMVCEVLVGKYFSENGMRRHVVIENMDEAVEMCRHHRGGFFMLGHFLNWEWIVDYANQFADYGIDCGTVYKQLSSKYFDRMMYSIRSRRGGFLIEMKQLLRVIIQRSKDPDAQPTFYAMLADQRPRKNARHYYTTLLNHHTSVLTGTEQLAVKFKYPIFYAHFTSISRGYYKMTLMPLYDPDKDGKPELGEITERFTRHLENNIQQEPSRWLWSHNRFSLKTK